MYEWIQAAHWDNMSYDDFEKMPTSYKEIVIAAYRNEMRIGAIIAKDRS